MFLIFLDLIRKLEHLTGKQLTEETIHYLKAVLTNDFLDFPLFFSELLLDKQCGLQDRDRIMSILSELKQTLLNEEILNLLRIVLKDKQGNFS